MTQSTEPPAEVTQAARIAALEGALKNAKWLLEGIKRAGWVTSPSYSDDMNLGLERIEAALTATEGEGA